MLTVHELSKLASVSARTLHYYDSIGLFKPTVIQKNGYRGYAEAEIIRLQQILFYKELGLSLKEIKIILERPDFDLITALGQHKKTIRSKVAQYQKLLETIDSTIAHLLGEKTMTEKEIFKGFSPEQQEQYAREAERMYDAKTVRESNQRWKGYSKEKQQAILREGGVIYSEMAGLILLDPADAKIQGLVQRWRDHMAYFWTPDLDQLEGLGHLYNEDQRFKANFDQIHPQLATYMLSAIRVYVANEKSNGKS